jgi:hypothetical protein
MGPILADPTRWRRLVLVADVTSGEMGKIFALGPFDALSIAKGQAHDEQALPPRMTQLFQKFGLIFNRDQFLGSGPVFELAFTLDCLCDLEWSFNSTQMSRAPE